MSLNYHILGLDIHASQEDIKTAYRRLALKYHPDINNSHNANLRFIEINRAYNNLCSNDGQNIEEGIFEEETFEDIVRRRYYERYVNNGALEREYNQDIAFKVKVAWAVVLYILFSVVFAIGSVYFIFLLNKIF